MRYFVEKDNTGKPKIGSAIYNSKRQTPSQNLFEITEFLKPCCNDIDYSLYNNFKKYYIGVNKKGNPIGGTLTDRNIKGNYVNITGAYILSLCCNDSPIFRVMSIQNFAGSTVEEYPLGVFNINQIFLGIANTPAEFVNLWNSNPANQAVGILNVHPLDQFKFILQIEDESFIDDFVYGMTYYEVKFSDANITMHLDNDVIFFNGSTLYNTNSFSTVSSSTNIMFNQGTSTRFIVPSFNMKLVAIPTYVANSPIYFFNNDNLPTIFAHLFSDIISSITGKFPTSIVHFGIRCIRANVPNIVGNIDWSNLNQLETFVIWNLGGEPFSLNIADVPTNLSSSLKYLYLADFSPSSGAGSDNIQGMTWLTEENYPNLRQFGAKPNGGSGGLTVYNSTWWNNLPKVDSTFSIRNVVFSATVADAMWNQMAINLNGIVPFDTKAIMLSNTTAVTAASLAARNYLISQGWTLILSI